MGVEQMKPRRIRLQNWKSFKDTVVELYAGLNVLVGPNASGKTSLLEAFKFLKKRPSAKLHHLTSLISNGGHTKTSFTAMMKQNPLLSSSNSNVKKTTLHRMKSFSLARKAL
uniref:Rad50/SbcC-type AAA domain-containing protein n=1 Tax=Caldiarchaeum subterraneum TaxID=311458 RepID=A0A7C5U6M2_CALS0